MFPATAVVILLLVAGDHLAVFRATYADSAYIGILFLALSLACLVLCVGIAKRLAAAWYAAAAVQAVAIALFVLSRTTGLPAFHEDDWLEVTSGVPLGVVALVAEGAFLITFTVALLTGRIAAADQPAKQAVEILGRAERPAVVEGDQTAWERDAERIGAPR